MCGPTNDAPPARILAVYGTEMGSTKVEAKKIVESWRANKSISVELVEGDKAADSFDSITASKYDVLVVMTSSYGDGDAPSGFGKFLYRLYEAARAAEDGAGQLRGLGHSVLGFGSSHYDTFQNVPRIVDRLLGESGSRRFLRRTEIDELDEMEDSDKRILAWSDAVAKHCAGGRGDADAPPVCEWTEPKDEVFEKKLGPDGFELAPDGSAGAKMILPFVVAAAAFAYYRFFYEQGPQD